MDPDFAVISVGADNPYGHPAQETLNRLRAAHSCIFRIDLAGTLTVTTDGETLSWRMRWVAFLPLVVRDRIQRRQVHRVHLNGATPVRATLADELGGTVVLLVQYRLEEP